ncbi:MAG: class I SAM-dependent methyltransferase [Chloroflexota bacterium]
MNKQELAEQLKAKFEIPFSGWDFSYLAGKMEETALPWNYRMLVEEQIKKAGSLLDMGTGGGEFLDSLASLPQVTFATEGYPPNLPIARERLVKKGVDVRQVLEDNVLPFEDRFFDLVINRHEAYDVAQVFRVLKPGAVFITQQVGGLNDIDINAMLGGPVPIYFDWCLLKTTEELVNKGFTIIKSDESMGKSRFYDVGSLVYYLKCIPWQIPDFSIDTSIDRLFFLHQYLSEHGCIDFINHRFYLIAKKPA